MSAAASSSSTMMEQPRMMRVYNRRPRSMTRAQARDWASLPPSLLERVFRSLEVSDLQSAKETCRQWKAQANTRPRGGGDGVDGPAAAAADIPSVDAVAESWMDTVEAIVLHLQDLHQVREVELDEMMHFLVQEGIIKAAP